MALRVICLLFISFLPDGSAGHPSIIYLLEADGSAGNKPFLKIS